MTNVKKIHEKKNQKKLNEKNGIFFWHSGRIGRPVPDCQKNILGRSTGVDLPVCGGRPLQKKTHFHGF